MPLRLSLVFNFADFFAYLKAFLTKGTLGLSDFHYPQTVQRFILASFPHSFYRFLLILALSLCSLGIFLFFLAVKKEMNGNFCELSRFLRMDNGKIARQARLAVLSRQAFIWSFFAPVIFVVLLFFEVKLEIPGLGNTIKTAFERGDFPLFYGSSLCTFIFVFIVNLFFLTLKCILPHK
jgi:ABC-type dipeptide/oligopeptide/nickel transport system permease component